MSADYLQTFVEEANVWDEMILGGGGPGDTSDSAAKVVRCQLQTV